MATPCSHPDIPEQPESSFPSLYKGLRPDIKPYAEQNWKLSRQRRALRQDRARWMLELSRFIHLTMSRDSIIKNWDQQEDNDIRNEESLARRAYDDPESCISTYKVLNDRIINDLPRLQEAVDHLRVKTLLKARNSGTFSSHLRNQDPPDWEQLSNFEAVYITDHRKLTKQNIQLRQEVRSLKIDLVERGTDLAAVMLVKQNLEVELAKLRFDHKKQLQDKEDIIAKQTVKIESLNTQAAEAREEAARNLQSETARLHSDHVKQLWNKEAVIVKQTIRIDFLNTQAAQARGETSQNLKDILAQQKVITEMLETQDTMTFEQLESLVVDNKSWSEAVRRFFLRWMGYKA